MTLEVPGRKCVKEKKEEIMKNAINIQGLKDLTMISPCKISRP